MSVLNILTMGRKQPLFSVIFFQTKCPTFAKAWGRDISRCVINIWPRWSLMRSATSDRDPIEGKLMRPELYTYRYVLNSFMIYFRYNDISMCSRAEHAGYLILKRCTFTCFLNGNTARRAMWLRCVSFTNAIEFKGLTMHTSVGLHASVFLQHMTSLTCVESCKDVCSWSVI